MYGFSIHSAVTIVEEVSPIIGVKTKEHEVAQFACMFESAKKQVPVPESYFRKAFREMEEKCLHEARRAGLIK